MTVTTTQDNKTEFFAVIKNEFMTQFDNNIGVNIENEEALMLYTELVNNDPVELSEIERLLATLD